MGGDPIALMSATDFVSFNPRPHMGGDKNIKFGFGIPWSFNPRPHMGGDLISTNGSTVRLVSIHAPTWGATVSGNNDGSHPWFQSTPPHGGRPAKLEETRRKLVSIHAPTWGATRSSDRLMELYVFQSTPPHGGRRELPTFIPLGKVSIHAPTWGATGVGTFVEWLVRFNPRPHMGGDRLRISCYLSIVSGTDCAKGFVNNQSLVTSSCILLIIRGAKVQQNMHHYPFARFK